MTLSDQDGLNGRSPSPQPRRIRPESAALRIIGHSHFPRNPARYKRSDEKNIAGRVYDSIKRTVNDARDQVTWTDVGRGVLKNAPLISIGAKAAETRDAIRKARQASSTAGTTTLPPVGQSLVRGAAKAQQTRAVSKAVGAVAGVVALPFQTLPGVGQAVSTTVVTVAEHLVTNAGQLGVAGSLMAFRTGEALRPTGARQARRLFNAATTHEDQKAKLPTLLEQDPGIANDVLLLVANSSLIHRASLQADVDVLKEMLADKDLGAWKVGHFSERLPLLKNAAR